MTATDPLTAAREMRELIESEAELVDQKSTMTPPVVDGLVDSGLFRLLMPRALGGMEADPATIVDVHEELSFADGSVGWSFAQNTTVMAYAAYLEPKYAEPLSRARAGAGMFAPLGIARRESGGFRISGSYPFASGCAHAEFMGGSAMVMQEGEMAPFDDGLPQIRAFIVPADRVVIKENWDVMGLRGTGSFDFEVPEQHVEMTRYAPNFRNSIEHMATFAPYHYESMFGCTDGDFCHGLIHPEQMVEFRPIPGWQGGYRTPIEDLFLCGAACHPGPGVTFLPGYNSAHVVLEDLGIETR